MPDPYSILIVDDQSDLRAALRRHLKKGGHSVTEMPDATCALTYLNEHEVDIVVSDYEMPGLTGLEFLNQVRIRWPNVLRILLTGKADVHLAVRALNEGAAHRFLLKPWKELSLLGTLELAMRTRSMRPAS